MKPRAGRPRLYLSALTKEMKEATTGADADVPDTAKTCHPTTTS